ncbi:MAG TPA: JAB domain-containing protein [Phycisphaerae bacterium]|nr:JAB domain-containing protein [Phycisphaerae bacterium]
MTKERVASSTQAIEKEHPVTSEIFKAYRVEVVRQRLAEPGPELASPAAVAKHCGHLQQFDRERLIRLDLNPQCRLIGAEVVAIGSADALWMSIREVFKGAMLVGATSIVILHNHPSGNPTPSKEDRLAEARLREAGELLGIPMVDFLVIGDNGRYWSASESR